MRFTPLLAACLLAGCALFQRGDGPAILIDGAKGLSNFEILGDGNWRAADGFIEVTEAGKDGSYLVSKKAYVDFALRVEFWASEDANSGVFLRCEDPKKPTDASCYEANIFDRRPDPIYATGGIVGVAPAPQPPPQAGGRWNVYEIIARGDLIAIALNGKKTVEIRETRHLGGRIALQRVAGTLRFRKLAIVPFE